MRSEGMGMKGVVVGSTVLLVVFAILFAVQRYVTAGTAEENDIKKMRSIYGAIYIYEAGHDELPPPDLLTIRRDLGDDSLLQAENDPQVPAPLTDADRLRMQDKVREPTYPLDPALPNLKAKSPVRISFAYLPMWVRHGEAKVKNWRKEVADVKVGLLSSYWYGSIDSENSDGRNCTGPVIRINMDGSAYRLPRRSHPDELTAEDLFFRR